MDTIPELVVRVFKSTNTMPIYFDECSVIWPTGDTPPSLVQKVYKELGGKGKVEVFGNRIYVMEECGENGRFGFEVSVGD